MCHVCKILNASMLHCTLNSLALHDSIINFIYHTDVNLIVNYLHEICKASFPLQSHIYRAFIIIILHFKWTQVSVKRYFAPRNVHRERSRDSFPISLFELGNHNLQSGLARFHHARLMSSVNTGNATLRKVLSI